MVYAVTRFRWRTARAPGTRGGNAPPAEIRAESPDEYDDERRPTTHKNHQRIPAVMQEQSDSPARAKFFRNYSVLIYENFFKC